MGGAAVVMDAGAACSTDGGMDATWGAIKDEQVTQEPRRVERSDRLGWRSDHQPLFHWRSDHLGSRSDHQPLFQGRSDRPDMRSDH
jgi:hypothetical protein